MFNNAFEKTKRTIAKEGFAVMAIGSSPTSPSFAYTIGLHIHYNHPELIIIGLPIEVAYQVLNTLGHAIKTDNLILPVGGLYNEVLSTCLPRFCLSRTRTIRIT